MHDGVLEGCVSYHSTATAGQHDHQPRSLAPSLLLLHHVHKLCVCAPHRSNTTSKPAAARPQGLPVELVTAILHHATQQTRHSLSRVCKGWRAASLAASKQLVVPNCSPNKLADLVDWLSAHEPSLTRLTSLQLSVGSHNLQNFQQLPCSHLRELQLHSNTNHIALRPAALHACAGTLTKLVVKGESIHENGQAEVQDLLVGSFSRDAALSE